MRHLVKSLMIALLIMLAAAMLAGCGSDPEEEAVKQVLSDQLDFLRNEDLEGVMSTMHPESPVYSQTRAIVEQVFELYDLEYDLESVEVVEMSDNQAKLRAVQVTRKVSGPELADTRVTAIHTIRKTGSGWKLYESQTESSETLDSGNE